MENQFSSAFAEVFRRLVRTHPLLASLPDRDFQNTMNAFQPPRLDVVNSWTKSLLDYQTKMTQVWLDTCAGQSDSPERVDKDRRFKHGAWNEGIFPYLRDTYKLTAQTLIDIADAAGLPHHEQRKLSFYARLITDTLAPSNFAATNPEVWRRAQETGGQSLLDGFRNLLADIEKGYITTTDENDFEVGKNLATTEGAVVFRNDLIELIQYRPVTPKVQAKPVLIVPPCVNKFYIFDINEQKSIVRYMLEQGLDVYMISWRNPGPDLQDFGWDEYVDQGVFTALSVCLEISRAKKVDLLSWCNGGTMLTVALAIMDAEQKESVGTATFLSSMIDFSDPGEVEVFIDRPQVETYNTRLRSNGVAHGRDIARAMALLHANESIWGFVVNNYLLGKTPPPFDVLYWNADTSNLPGKWYSYYVKKMYLENLLKESGALQVLGKSVDTRTIDVPCYFVGAIGDHIVPWKTSYEATRLVGGDPEFILTEGGHVSGTVINHPVRNRKTFFSGGNRSLPADAWKETAAPTEGSWWPHWIEWISAHKDGEPRMAPRSPGSKEFPVLGPAPGEYVVEVVRQDG